MADEVEVAWIRLAVLGGGVLAFVLLARGVSAVFGIAYNEFRYHARDLDAWAGWLSAAPRGALRRQ